MNAMNQRYRLLACAVMAGAFGATGLLGCGNELGAAQVAGQATNVGTNTGTNTGTGSATVGMEIDDSITTARVKAALLADPNLKSFDFRVVTRKGEVQLSGFVRDLAQYERAAELTQAIQGVKGVQNNVALNGKGRSVGEKVDDIIITARVNAALLADARVNSQDVTVVTREGEVQLSGFMESQRQIERALKVAGQVQNVARVSNAMSVRQ
jgi:hyperosmotically inducible protein